MKSKIETVFTVSSPRDISPAEKETEEGIRTIGHIGSHETIQPKNYEFLMHICFQVRGKNLDSRIANPLLRKFRQQIENYKFEEAGIKAWTVRVDEFEADLVSENLAICSQQILWRANDPRGFSLETIRPKLLRIMLMQRLEDDETNITIQMTDAIFGDKGSKRSRWPRNEKGKEQSFV